MIEFSSDEIYQAFESAPNLNAALKNFLKREVQRGDPVEKFIKNLRKVSTGRNSAAMKLFIDKNLPDYQQHFLLLAGYANADAVNSISEKVIEKHADAFNATYQESDSGIDITDRAQFEAITREVVTTVENGIKDHKLPGTQFMKLVLANSIFEDKVLKEVTPYFQ